MTERKNSNTRVKAGKRTLQLESPPTSPLRGSDETPHEKDAPIEAPPAKKMRVEPNVEDAVAPDLQKLDAKPEIADALSKIAAPIPPTAVVSQPTTASTAVSVPIGVPKLSLSMLLRPVAPDIAEELYNALTEWWRNDRYFANNQWSSLTSMTPEMKAHPKSDVKWVDVKLRPPPAIRSCIWVDSSRLSVTRADVEADIQAKQQRDNNGDDDEGRSNYFIKASVLRGKHAVCKEQEDYFCYIKDHICTSLMLLMARTAVTFKPKIQLLQQLTSDPDIGGRGEFKTVAEVPPNFPKLHEIRNDWVTQSKLQLSHKYMKEGATFVYYSQKTDAWRDKVKIEWGHRVDVRMAFMGPDGSVESVPVDRQEDVTRLKMSCPFGVEHTVSARTIDTDKTTQFKVDLVLWRVTFFPQLNQLMALRDGNSGSAVTVTEERKSAAAKLYASYQEIHKQTQSLALTDESTSSSSSSGASQTEQFAAYRVDHAM